MYARVVNCLKALKTLIENLFGFRKQHPSYMALMIVIGELIKSLDTGDFITRVVLYFSIALHNVDHNVLLSKLYYYGISGVPFMWFQSHLSGNTKL